MDMLQKNRLNTHYQFLSESLCLKANVTENNDHIIYLVYQRNVHVMSNAESVLESSALTAHEKERLLEKGINTGKCKSY